MVACRRALRRCGPSCPRHCTSSGWRSSAPAARADWRSGSRRRGRRRCWSWRGATSCTSGTPMGSARDTLFLGASMTKSVLAHLVGRALRDGLLALTDQVTAHVPELLGSGYDGTSVLDVLTMTTGVDWVEDHRDPASPASRLLGCFALGRRLACAAARGAAERRSGHPVQLLHRRLAGARLGARASHRPHVRRRRSPASGSTSAAPDDAAVAVDGSRVAMAGGGLAATARDWARVALLAVDGGALLDADWVEAAARPTYPFLAAGPAAEHASPPTQASATTGGPSTPRVTGVTADGSRGQFVVRRPAHRRRRRQDLAVALRRRRARPTARDLSYLGLHAAARHAIPLPHGEGVRTVNRNVIITCALTGAGDTVGRSEHVPVTPEQIAESGIAAARAGAAIVHVHVRDPETGQGSREVALYREVVERIRASDVDVIINTTAGMGGDLVLDPRRPDDVRRGHRPRQRRRAARARRGAAPRHLHARLRQPELRRGQPGLRQHAGHAARGCEADPGARRRVARWRSSTPATCGSPRSWSSEGLIDAPAMYQLCMGIPYGAPADPLTLAAMVNQLPPDAVWASFALGRDADAVGGAVGAARRPRPRRPGGQPLPQQGREGDQRPAGRAARARSSRRWARRSPPPTRRARSSR